MTWDKWDLRFLRLAEHIASWSKDPSTQVGAVIVSPRRSIVSAGYNGFPIGVEDLEERLINREVKYKMVVHAEKNAIAFAEKPLQDCTIYTWPCPPCSQCSALIIQTGICQVVGLEPSEDIRSRWAEDFKLTRAMLAEGDVHYREVPRGAFA